MKRCDELMVVLIWQLVPGMKAAKKGTILLTGATAAMRGGAKFSVLSPGNNCENVGGDPG